MLWLIHRFLAFLCVLLVVLVLNVVIVFNVVLVLVFDVVASAIAIDFAIGLTIRLAIGDGSRLGGRRGIGLAIKLDALAPRRLRRRVWLGAFASAFVLGELVEAAMVIWQGAAIGATEIYAPWHGLVAAIFVVIC